MFEGKKGRCKVVFDDGSEYDGEIENGKRHGTGKFTYTNGDVYEGDWKEDECHGTGKLMRPNGYVYEGEFKDGKADGRGKLNGMRKGIGKFSSSNGEYAGDMYEGEFKDDMRHGTGKYTWSNGNVYEGQWKENKKHGTGTYTCAGESTYAGEWADGKKHGSGTFTDSNGDKYKRVYINGKRESDKRVATLINGPPSQRRRTDGGIASVVVLNDEHTECGICFTAFSSNMSSTDEVVRRHLPVLSTCGHCCCLGCVRDRQVAIGEGNNGVVPERIACMACMEADAFSPSEPRYHRWLIDLLERQFPARND